MRQLACARIQSEEGQDYLKSMAAAANYAWGESVKYDVFGQAGLREAI